MNYPNKKEHTNKTYIEYGKRGMTLESDINSSNKYYLENDIAIIHKKPTPTKVMKLVGNRIKDGFYEIPSTTDYNGIYKGKYIDFEAKQTQSNTSFPKNNIHEHQLIHLEKVNKHGGISFIIIRFTSINKTYLIFTKEFINYFKENNTKKSIPLSYIEENGFLIKDGYNPIIDYLAIVDKFI